MGSAGEGFSFEKLDVYRKSVDFVIRIYSLTKKFPKDELFGLTNQLRRAAVSVSANIAEGSARSKKDFGRFLNIAKGSICECVTLLELSCHLSYIDEPTYQEREIKLIELSKMVAGLRKNLGSERQ